MTRRLNKQNIHLFMNNLRKKLLRTLILNCQYPHLETLLQVIVPKDSRDRLIQISFLVTKI